MAKKKKFAEEVATPEEIEIATKEAEAKKIKAIENDLRDLINWIEIKNKEEVEAGTKCIEDDTRDELIEKIKEIAIKLGLTV